MALFNFKQWFRDEITPYLAVIKTQIASVSGSNHGFFTLVSAFPVSAGVNDFLILTQDDGSSKSGFYSYNGSAWVFAMDIATFQEAVDGIIASSVDWSTGTATNKVPTVLQVKTDMALVGGNSSQKFLASAPEENSDEVARANDFNFSISQVEAQADYDNA